MKIRNLSKTYTVNLLRKIGLLLKNTYIMPSLIKKNIFK